MSLTPHEMRHTGVATTPHVPAGLKQKQMRMGVLALLVSDVTFVAALFFSYLYLRALNVNHMWRPPSVHPLPRWEGLVAALVVAVGALSYRWGDLGGRRGDQGRLRAGLAGGISLFVVALGYQIWQFTTFGFAPGASGYASATTALAAYHTFHLCLAVVLGVAIFNRARAGRFGAEKYTEVQVVGYFWYWVVTMAVLMAFLPT